MSQLVPYIFEPDPPEPEETFEDYCDGLSDREKAFVLAYVGRAGFNAGRAAAAAGYQGTPGYLRKAGCVVKQREHVRAAIDKFLNAEVATVEESLARISRRASASIDHLWVTLPDGSRHFDIAAASENGAIDAIQKLTVKRNKFTGEETVTIQMYDAEAADEFLLKARGVGRDKSGKEPGEGGEGGYAGVVVLPDNDRVPDMDEASEEDAAHVAEEATRTAEAIQRNQEEFGDFADTRDFIDDEDSDDDEDPDPPE